MGNGLTWDRRRMRTAISRWVDLGLDHGAGRSD
jgi:hypothetical protein